MSYPIPPAELPFAPNLEHLQANPGQWHLLGWKEDGPGNEWQYALEDPKAGRQAILDAADIWAVFCPLRRQGKVIEWLAVALKGRYKLDFGEKPKGKSHGRVYHPS